MTTITITIDHNLTNCGGIAILPDMLIKEEEAAWIWDHYFAFVLNKLSAESAERLLLQSTQWAQALTQNLTSPLATLKDQGYLMMDEQANFDQLTSVRTDIYIKISSLPNTLPALHFYVPDTVTEYQLAHTAFALANFFLTNYQHFYKELPLHIMAMKKFYSENNPFTDESSVSGAPLFAMQIAMQFHQQHNH